MGETTSFYDIHKSAVTASRCSGHAEFMKQAQRREFEELSRIVTSLRQNLGRPLTILDLGVGNGRVPMLFALDITRKNIEKYVGIDVSEYELSQAKQNVSYYFPECISLIHGNANALNSISWPAAIDISKPAFDIIWTTYFTGGNFRPLQSEGCSEINRTFVSIFSWCWKRLKPGGALVLGSTYIDSCQTREKQDGFYRRCGLNIISTPQDHFTATKEGFWSERFTSERLFSYFQACDIPKECVSFIPLDDEQFARTVYVQK